MTNVLVRNGRERASATVKAVPHRWALSLWARGYRRLARPWVVSRHVRGLCQPFDVTGLEHLDRLRAPALVIANHISHFDTLIVLSILPNHLYSRIAVTAAADRFYTQRLKGAWFSLRYNAFPIARGGGRAALEYSASLLQRDWSLLIFPEGSRSRTGELLPFHAGPAILALQQGVPVLPIRIDGASDILTPGTRRARPAPVRVRVGPPLTFDENDTVATATARMEAAVQALAQPDRILAAVH